MDPVTIAIVAFVGTVIVAVVALTMKKLIEWFRSRKTISSANQTKLGIILTKRLNSRDYVEVPGVFSKPAATQIVQAIYDPATEEVLDARAVSSGDVKDPQLLEKAQRGDGMIVFS